MKVAGLHRACPSAALDKSYFEFKNSFIIAEVYQHWRLSVNDNSHKVTLASIGETSHPSSSIFGIAVKQVPRGDHANWLPVAVTRFRDDDGLQFLPSCMVTLE